MPSRKALEGVIRGFLGTYVSRNSDFDGSLLFGFVIDGLTVEEIDLIVPASASYASSPYCELSRLARHKFQDQLSKFGLPLSVVRNATLTIRKGEPSTDWGADVFFNVRVETDLGRVYEGGVHEFIFPNNPKHVAASPERWRSPLASVLSGVLDWLRLH
jgi:hypothetical protein